MAESRVTLSGGVLELAGRLSEEDRLALVAILQSAAVELAPDEPEVEAFGADQSSMFMRMQMTMDERSQLLSTLGNIMAKISSTDETITQNLK